MRYIKRNNSEVSKEEAAALGSRLGLSTLTARILLSRGLSESDALELTAKDFIPVPSDAIPNMELAAERIEEAMMVGEKIAVFGDYDADGICGTSIIINSFKSFGYDEVGYYIPNRISEGYGLNKSAIDIIMEQGCSLIITVDCGISNAEEVEYAKSLGIDVVVTDHHMPAEMLPDTICVNPKLGDDIRTQDFCGAVVALKLMCMLFDEGIYYENCDLAAIATIADMVELTGENRQIVKLGLSKINSRTNKNLAVLCDECLKSKKKIKADDIAYSIAPAINAAGRLDEADKCVELFTGACIDPRETAAILSHDNDNRRKVEKETYESAVSMINQMDLSATRAIILYNKNWHQGVLGIAASKIKNMYFRPVMLFTENDGLLVGSARSVEGLNIHDAIKSCEKYVSHYGGHFMAAGLSVEPQNFEAFKEMFENYIKSADSGIFLPTAYYDVKAETSEITMSFLKELEMLEPFGKGNPAPSLLVENVNLNGYSAMGSGGDHFRCRLDNSGSQLSAVAFFNQITPVESINYSAVVSPQINEWNGNKSVQAVIEDIKPHFTDMDWETIIKGLGESFELSQSQGYYAGKRNAYEKCGYEKLINNVKKSAFSNMILTVDAQSAMRIKSELGEAFAAFKFGVKYMSKTKSHANMIIAAPDIETLNFEGYDKVYIVSQNNLDGLYNSLKLSGKVYIISDNISSDKKYELTIEKLRELYVGYKKAVMSGDAHAFVQGSADAKLWEARAALKIFEETGLAKYKLNENKFMITDKKSVDITKSATYNNMKAGG